MHTHIARKSHYTHTQVEALQTHVLSAAVQERALTALHNHATSAPQRAALRRAGALACLPAALAAHPAREGVAVAACLALANLRRAAARSCICIHI